MEGFLLRNCFKVGLGLFGMNKKNGTRTNADKRGHLNLINEVKRKKEFSGLPDSVVERALREVRGQRSEIGDGFDVKEARKLLRKYFGVFLTNRVLRFGSRKSKVEGRKPEEMLGVHISSKKREYEEFYGKIFEVVGGSGREGEDFDDCRHRRVGSVVDLGCGVNGFSYEYLRDVVGDIEYVGVEAAGQLVDQMNVFFKENSFSLGDDSSPIRDTAPLCSRHTASSRLPAYRLVKTPGTRTSSRLEPLRGKNLRAGDPAGPGEPDVRAIRGDLFDVDMVLDILKKARKDRVVFLFQVVDALESVERNFSLKLISAVMESAEVLVISVPLVSLGGGRKFAVKRKWLMDFLEDKFKIDKDFEMFGERILVVR